MKLATGTAAAAAVGVSSTAASFDFLESCIFSNAIDNCIISEIARQMCHISESIPNGNVLFRHFPFGSHEIPYKLYSHTTELAYSAHSIHHIQRRLSVADDLEVYLASA